MGTIDLCPTEASTDDLYEWYNTDPWHDDIAAHRFEETSGRGHRQSTTTDKGPRSSS